MHHPFIISAALALLLVITACTPTGNTIAGQNTTMENLTNNTADAGVGSGGVANNTPGSADVVGNATSNATPHITAPPVTGPASNAGAMLAGDMPVRSSTITYGPAQGYLVEPEAAGSYPGVVLIHEWWGLNDQVKQAAAALASHGYRVLAVDLYKGQVADDPQVAMRLVQAVNQTEATSNMRAAAQYLRSTGSDRIGSYGWCFGGAQSLQLSLSGEPLNATIIYYGQLQNDPQALRQIRWPLLGIFAAQDQSIPVSTVQQFNRSLQTAGVQHDIRIYPGVGHAFANPSGGNYAPQQTADAWNRTLAFLNRTLKQP